MVNINNCLICRVKINPSRIPAKGENKFLYSTWKSDCAKTLSQIIFDSKTHYLVHYLQKYEYCSKCLQTLRDLHFTWKQLQAFQKKLTKFTSLMKRRIKINGVKSSKNVIDSKAETNLDILSSLKDKSRSTFIRKANQFSYDEVVQMIYATVVSSTSDLSETDEAEIERNHKIKTEDFVLSDDESADEEEFDWNFDVKREDSNTCDPLEIDAEITEKVSSEVVEKKISLKRPKREYNVVTIEPIRKNESEIDCSRDNYTNLTEAESEDFKIAPVLEKPKLRKNMKITGKRRVKIPVKLKPAKKNIPTPKKTTSKKRVKSVNVIMCSEDGCFKKFRRRETMDIHIALDHKGEKTVYDCPQCPKKFKWNRSLKDHMMNIHDGTYGHICKFCGKDYEHEEELNLHCSASHQGPNPFSCAFCDEIHTNSIDLIRHMRQSHPNSNKPKCETCGKVFNSKPNLRTHEKMHKDPELLPKCSVCKRAFATNARLRKHLLTHNQGTDFTCHVCGKCFKNYRLFYTHNLTSHREDRPFTCKICGKGFSRTGSLKCHEATHAGVKPFYCSVCGKPFAHKYNMLAHEKIHSADHLARNKAKSSENENCESVVTVTHIQIQSCDFLRYGDHNYVQGAGSG